MADTCVFADLCWTPSALEQAEANVHREDGKLLRKQGRGRAGGGRYFTFSMGKGGPRTQARFEAQVEKARE